MDKFISQEREKNQRENGEKQPLIQDIFEHLLRNADGVCYQELKALDPNNRFNKFGYRIWNNDQEWLASQSKWYRENYYYNDETGWQDPIIVQRKKPCWCKKPKCFLVYLKDLDEVPYDPYTDHKGHIFELRAVQNKKKKLDPKIKALYHDTFFDDPENTLAQEIDRFIEEERLEDYGREVI